MQNAEGDAIDDDAVPRRGLGRRARHVEVDKVLKIVGGDLDARVRSIYRFELSDEVVVKLRETNDMAYSAIFSTPVEITVGQAKAQGLPGAQPRRLAALASYRRLLALIPG